MVKIPLGFQSCLSLQSREPSFPILPPPDHPPFLCTLPLFSLWSPLLSSSSRCWPWKRLIRAPSSFCSVYFLWRESIRDNQLVNKNHVPPKIFSKVFPKILFWRGRIEGGILLCTLGFGKFFFSFLIFWDSERFCFLFGVLTIFL